MELITIHFLFNLSLLVIFFFLYFSILRISGSILQRKRTSILYFIISLLICYLFSYSLNDEVILDLRIIPLIIGGLYLGLSPILGLIVISLRGFYGMDLGFYLSIPIYGILSIFLWKVHPHFLQLSSKYRIISSTMLTLIVSIFTLTLVLNTIGAGHTLDLFIAYVFVPPLGVAIHAYTIEMVEKILLQRQLFIKAEKREAVEQMGAAISHEIRNPLTTAIGFLELLNKEPLESDKRKQYLTILKEELDFAEKIIQDYLAYSKPSVETSKELNIQEELPIVLKLLQPLANYYSVEIISNLSSMSLIEGDRAKFQHSFINIIKNLIVMSDGGTIFINTEETKTNIFITINSSTPMIQMKTMTLDMSIDFGIIKTMKGSVQTKITENGTTYYFSFRSMKTPLKCIISFS